MRTEELRIKMRFINWLKSLFTSPNIIRVRDSLDDHTQDTAFPTEFAKMTAEIRKEKECCRKHWGEADGQTSVHWGGCLMNPIGAPMIACGVCGNKRCPKATDCELACTGSNELGQVGSIYGIIGKQKG